MISSNLLNWSLLIPEIFCAIASLNPANTPEVIAWCTQKIIIKQKTKFNRNQHKTRRKAGIWKQGRINKRYELRKDLGSKRVGLKLNKIFSPCFFSYVRHDVINPLSLSLSPVNRNRILGRFRESNAEWESWRSSLSLQRGEKIMTRWG